MPLSGRRSTLSVNFKKMDAKSNFSLLKPNMDMSQRILKKSERQFYYIGQNVEVESWPEV